MFFLFLKNPWKTSDSIQLFFLLFGLETYKQA